MKILFTCKEFPHSKVIGGPIIIYNRLKYFSRNHTVSLAAFFKEEEKKYISSVEPFCHDVQLVPLPPKRSPLKASWDFFTSSVPYYFLRVHGSRRMAQTISEMVRKDRYDFVIAEYSVMGQFLHGNTLLPPVRRIISVHECYYLARRKAYRQSQLGFNKLKEAINLKGLKKYEFNMYRNADKVLTLTPQGKEELLKIDPELDIAVVPHGVDTDDFSFSDFVEKEKNIVFVGNYLHYPNVDAVLFFANEIWPLLKSRLPEVKCIVVGQAPPPEIQSLSLDNAITVTGRVDDVRPFLKKGRAFICPVRLGGGFRGKILEAMAIGRPVVSTSLGAEGVPAQQRENIILADKPEEFAQGILDLMTDDTLFERIRTNARKLVEEKYAWEKGVEIMEEVLGRMLKETPSLQNQGVRK
ncbi:MAG: glycosyltransferase [Candidatus Aminicenantes bacterium]|jgi:glycosyltransferase involved in cell wall biosynthesis